MRAAQAPCVSASSAIARSIEARRLRRLGVIKKCEGNARRSLLWNSDLVSASDGSTARISALTGKTADAVAAKNRREFLRPVMRLHRSGRNVMSTGETVMSVAPKAVLAACARRGVAFEVLEAFAPSARKLFSRADGRLPFDLVGRLWEEAGRHMPEGGVGLRASQLVPFGAYKAYDRLLASAETPGEALNKAARLHAVLNEAVEVHMSVDRRKRCEVALGSRAPLAAPPGYVEYIAANIVKALRITTDVPDLPALEVQFAHEAPPDIEPYRMHFRCPVRFGGPGNRIVLPEWIFSVRQPRASAALCELLESHLHCQAKGLSDARAVASQMRTVLARERERGGIGALAKGAGLSRRTLQRRLRVRGGSYRSLSDELRRNQAIELLRDPNATCEAVAAALGFSEPSAFNRAFKRWTGKSPGEFRKQT
jgi:AraC-like DNA-binding protein